MALHPNVLQILSEFQENLQKKACFHPLPLDYYLANILLQKRAQQYDIVMETVKNVENMDTDRN